LTAEITAAYDEDFNPIPIPNGQTSEPVHLQVDFSIEISNLQSHEMGFGSAAFNINLCCVEDVAGWNSHNPQVDINGPLPGGTVLLFAIDGDFTDPADLQAIYVSVAHNITAPTDPRALIGQSGPQLIGSVFVLWDGTYPASISVTDLTFTTIGFDGKFLPSHDAEDFSIELDFLTPPDRADFNCDGFVDELDLAIWQAGYGQAPGVINSTGDADRDGDVDGRDFLVWQRQYAASQSALASIPEPGTVGLLMLSVVGSSFTRILIRRV
jgi:hypothetical protein